MTTYPLLTVSYLASAILFILSLKGLSHPETARRGNLFGTIGMIIAVVATAIAAGLLTSASLLGSLTAAAVIQPV